MSYIVANIESLRALSVKMGGGSPLFKVYNHGGVGYVVRTQEIEDSIHFRFRVEEDMPQEDTFCCGRCGRNTDYAMVTGICDRCEATERKDADRLKRQGNVDWVEVHSKGTPIERGVTTLRKHYSTQMVDYLDNGSDLLKQDILKETNTDIISLLDIEIAPKFTVRNSILKRLYDLDDILFILGEDGVSKDKLIRGMTFSRKETRNLNTAIDVYFQYNNKEYGVRFSDWNVFSVMSDEQCLSKLQDYVVDNDRIKHPAKSIDA